MAFLPRLSVLPNSPISLLAISLAVLAFVALASANPPTARETAPNAQQNNANARTEGEIEKNVAEKMERMNAFINYFRAKKFIDAHNLAFEKGEVPFKVAPNHLMHFTPAQYKRIRGLQMRSNRQRHNMAIQAGNSSTLPEKLDWREKGAVTEVKDQGDCGSCWAFSATGAIEGALAQKKSSKIISLSEQNLVDCSSKYGNEGCDGGLMDNAFEYVRDNNGLDTEESYPYEAVTGKCQFKNETVGGTVVSFKDLKEGDEEQLKIAVATIGPISVALDASNLSFQFYKTGVYYERWCSNRYLDHGVLLVGYGTDETHGDYWLVKNSWGPHWGENGYIRIARNKQNHCGIATMASYPVV
ncbi:hypothetical protein niasHT_038334 [Heterodera trifolii]|uniref:Cathepsin L-like n=1 Tax=Heterodera trifolii TaxID=157864 RepID=A0ABD2IAQ8_9BILA